MGLDQYLSAERFFWFNEPKPVIEGHELKSVRAEAAYWRKANQIHQWFVDNVQDGRDECEEHFVSREQLQELVDLCKEALKTKDASLLPPQSGFFFGSTDIDEWYWGDLEQTVEMITKALEAFDDKWEFYYRSSW